MSLDEAEITRLVTHVTEDPHPQPYHFTPGGPSSSTPIPSRTIVG